MTVERSGVIPTNYTICTSSTRPSAPLVGLIIYETNSKDFLIYDGSGWRRIENVSLDTILTWI